jgi:hypothetical protein
VPVFVLTVLKGVFLALLYFFVYRALHAAVVDIRGAPASRSAEPRAWAPARAPRQSAGRTRPPRSVAVADGGGKPRTVSLDGTALQIGRADACQIRLEDNYVSSFHARLFRQNGSWYVEDLGSTNGTYLNDRKVTSPAELHPGDRVRLGKTILEFKK